MLTLIIHPRALKAIIDDLVADLAGLTFGPPVTRLHNPLSDALAMWELDFEKYGQGPRELLMLGMNPGPCGLSNPYEGEGAGR